MIHRMSCPARETGGFCACAFLAPPSGTAYGFDTDYWKPIRAGSNFEVPSFRPRWEVSRIPLATGNRKKLYEKAVARALYNACEKVLGVGHPAVRYDGRFSVAADERLYQRVYS